MTILGFPYLCPQAYIFFQCEKSMVKVKLLHHSEMLPERLAFSSAY